MAFIQRVQYHTKQNRVLIIFMLTYSVFPSVFVCFFNLYREHQHVDVFVVFLHPPIKWDTSYK